MWGRIHIPKHSFIVWLALIRRLAVKTRLVQWRVMNDASYCFCHDQKEDVEHLFYDTLSRQECGLLFCKSMLYQKTEAKRSWRGEVSWFTKKTIGKSLACFSEKSSFLCGCLLYLD